MDTNDDIIISIKRKKFDRDHKLSHYCVVHDNDKNVCLIYHCNGIKFQIKNHNHNNHYIN